MDFSFTSKPNQAQAAASPFSGAPTGTAQPQAPALSMSQSAGNPGYGKASGKSLLSKLLTILFVILLAITAGLFAYQMYLNGQIETKKQTLAGYEGQLASIPLQEIRKLSARLKAGNQLVKDQPFANTMFKVLEDSVENDIVYKDLTLQSDTNAAYTATLEGEAPDYKTIIQQIETFKREPYAKYISQVQVKQLRPERTGKISFALTFIASIRGIIPEDVILRDPSMPLLQQEEFLMGTTTQVFATSTQSSGTSTKPRP